jgi:hypothetical protein
MNRCYLYFIFIMLIIIADLMRVSFPARYAEGFVWCFCMPVSKWKITLKGHGHYGDTD